jgi:hypothetical protein
MATELEDVARAADEVAAEQRTIARRARSMQRQRDRGEPWSSILTREPNPALLELVRSSARRLRHTAAHVARVLATGLSAEGESRRSIGQRLGVSHQRVTAMMRSTGHDARDDTA